MAPVPSPPIRKIKSERLIAELERRGLASADVVVHAPTNDLMAEVVRRSSAALCISYIELGAEKGWTMDIRGVHAMGPILRELLFSDGLDDLLDEDGEE